VVFSGVIIYFDEFFVTETMTELEVNLRQALARIREHNLKPQVKKCRFFLQQLPWPGHVIGDGEKKITRMRNMKF